ncbi:GST_C domain-containing protein/GST_N domain-containing protein [Cephalotus follicularis]|uniref:glutathione transferase n=1 Tax=Cephalotus follicularis TaxID=3775 RepID=A0A1Q3D931_CEPFO|nr:GST_C domain-containing protein/GST_N domain-containing protein [Cephalotus follicularis]
MTTMAINNRRVYGSLNSPATLRVLACLFEHDLDFEFVPIDLNAGEHKKKQFLSMNPFGQVPVYEDGDMKQFESRAIIRCMGFAYGKEGKELIYWDAKEQAVVANWIDVEDHQFEPPAMKLINKPTNGSTSDEAIVVGAKARLTKVLDVYEARLTHFKYLASNKYTIADVVHLPNLHALLGSKFKNLVESRPHVSEWCTEILARPAWAKVLEMQHKAQV